MVLSNLKRITKEDFPSADQDLVDKLAYVLNPFLDQIQQAFNKQITTTDNLSRELTTITVNMSNPIVKDGGFAIGTYYTIINAGTTDWTSIGLAPGLSPTVTNSKNVTFGQTFLATSPGAVTGTGTAKVANIGTPNPQAQIKTALKNIAGINVINAINTTNTGSYPITSPFVSWTLNNNIITLNNITGLQDNTKYTLTLEVIS